MLAHVDAYLVQAMAEAGENCASVEQIVKEVAEVVVDVPDRHALRYFPGQSVAYSPSVGVVGEQENFHFNELICSAQVFEQKFSVAFSRTDDFKFIAGGRDGGRRDCKSAGQVPVIWLYVRRCVVMNRGCCAVGSCRQKRNPDRKGYQ